MTRQNTQNTDSIRTQTKKTRNKQQIKLNSTKQQEENAANRFATRHSHEFTEQQNRTKQTKIYPQL